MTKSSAVTQLPLPSLVRASSWDAGNASMRAGGRTAWNEDDYDAACETFNRIRTACYGEGPEGGFKFQIAEQLQKAGHLWLGMKSKDFFAVIQSTFDECMAQSAAA